VAVLEKLTGFLRIRGERPCGSRTTKQRNELSPPYGLQQIRALDFRSGSKADVTLLNFNVRFTPESGHSPTQSGCLLW
jgi:hypothetical protein